MLLIMNNDILNDYPKRASLVSDSAILFSPKKIIHSAQRLLTSAFELNDQNMKNMCCVLSLSDVIALSFLINKKNL